MPTPSQILRLLPQNEEMIVRVHRRQQERYRAALARERREAGSWSQLGMRRVRMPDGTHMKFRIPRLTYMMWQRKLGDECWEDPGFVKEYLRDNPQFRVTSTAVNPLVGWTPASEKARMYRRMVPAKPEPAPAQGTILSPNGRVATSQPAGTP